ncbi:hypothetical protein H0H93_000821 [Arthromyces matolae]|nr:hypothetical protein H0H93_000821 [Arthromyces matolae]
MKSYLIQCTIAFTTIVHLLIVVNAAPLPSDDELGSPEPPSSFADHFFNDLCWQHEGETPDTHNDPELEDVPYYNVLYIRPDSESTAGGSTNPAFTLSPTTGTEPLTQSETPNTAQYRVDEQKFTRKAAKTLITCMLKHKLKPSQYPWKQNGEWSDKVLRTAIGAMYRWQINAFERKGRLEKTTQIENTGGQGTKWPKPHQKTTAQLLMMNRPQLSSEMDTLWDWAVKQKRANADTRSASAQKKLNGDSKQHMSDEEVVELLIKSIPPYDPAIGMSKMPWRESDTFQWSQNDVKKVLSRIFEVQRLHRGVSDPQKDKQNKQKNAKTLNGPMETLRDEMDVAWKWWLGRRETEGRNYSMNRLTKMGSLSRTKDLQIVEHKPQDKA